MDNNGGLHRKKTEMRLPMLFIAKTAMEIYLRQFFVMRPLWRKGIGKRAVEILINQLCPRQSGLPSKS